jgi:hypothetical protein
MSASQIRDAWLDRIPIGTESHAAQLTLKKTNKSNIRVTNLPPTRENGWYCGAPPAGKGLLFIDQTYRSPFLVTVEVQIMLDNEQKVNDVCVRKTSDAL